MRSRTAEADAGRVRTESTQIELSEEQIAYINEPYVHMAIKGHA